MAKVTIDVTVGTVLGSGEVPLTLAGKKTPDLNAAITDVAAAMVVGNIAGDPTSLTAVTLVQTDLNGTANADVKIIIDLTKIATVSKLHQVFQKAEEWARGNSLFTA